MFPKIYRNLKFFFALYYVIIFVGKKVVNGQISDAFRPLRIVRPSDCARNQYFDASKLSCRDCPPNSQTLTSDCKFFIILIVF
jgi:hypothetical protein